VAGLGVNSKSARHSTENSQEAGPWPRRSGQNLQVSGGERRYAAGAGTRARATLGTSCHPSMCWQVRIQMALPGFGSPYRAL
jgi:hypothetical protein